MNLKFVSLLNERSRRFQSPDIGPVSKLCLSIAPNHLGTRTRPAICVHDLTRSRRLVGVHPASLYWLADEKYDTNYVGGPFVSFWYLTESLSVGTSFFIVLS